MDGHIESLQDCAGLQKLSAIRANSCSQLSRFFLSKEHEADGDISTFTFPALKEFSAEVRKRKCDLLHEIQREKRNKLSKQGCEEAYGCDCYIAGNNPTSMDCVLDAAGAVSAGGHIESFLRYKRSTPAALCADIKQTIASPAHNGIQNQYAMDTPSKHKHSEISKDARSEAPIRSGSATFGASLSRRASILPRVHVMPEVTVLVLDIKNFTAQCSSMSADKVGEWIVAFYGRVDAVAAAHGVRKVEVRGDCCICVAGVEGGLPIAPRGAAAARAVARDRRGDQVTRMLAFAAAIHADLATLSTATAARMGVATGAASFLVGGGASPFQRPARRLLPPLARATAAAAAATRLGLQLG